MSKTTSEKSSGVVKYVGYALAGLILGAAAYYGYQYFFGEKTVAALPGEKKEATGRSSKTKGNYKFVDSNNGDGTCWRGTYNNDGTPIALYKGVWASNECRLTGVQAPQRNMNTMLMPKNTMPTKVMGKMMS